MRFLEFLRIRDKYYYITLNPPAFIASVFLLYCFSAGPEGIVFAFCIVACIIGFVKLLFEYQSFQKVHEPTWFIYDSLMKAAAENTITVSNHHAIFHSPDGAITYNRALPGSLKNEEFKYFSLVEREIIEYPFRQATIAVQKENSNNRKLTPQNQQARNQMAYHFRNRDNDEK